MRFTKLNDDSSWLWEINGIKILVDPWFTPSQVDFFPWFSEQFHVSPQPTVSEIPKPDYLFISHPFTDHCNKETLLNFPKEIPVIGNDTVLNKIRKWHHFEQLIHLSEAPLTMSEFKPKSKLDLVHSVFHIASTEGSILYAPHGSVVKDLPKAKVLLTTVSEYRLPFWLGGTVNLGFEKALTTFNNCGAEFLLCTHDEQKLGKGLVARLARKNYTMSIENPVIKILKAGEAFEVN
jgi:hypothetical protein